MGQIRINKYLTRANFCSRRQADRLIEQGKIRIDDRQAVLGDKVSSQDKIYVNGQEIKLNQSKKVYLAFHKPVGVICTTDKKARDNIIDAVNYPVRIYPIGRLDVRSSGLILLTNDGEIVNKILKGQHKVEKEYLVEVDKDLTHEFLEKLEMGVMLDGFKTLPARVNKISARKFKIIIVEGKNKQIRRMCEGLGYRVTSLKRFRIGTILLDDLREGKYKKISDSEIKKLI